MPWTPGPWEWDHAALKAGPNEFVIWPSNAITEPETTAQAIGACGVSAERDANANAKLIALAPDMAVLLKRLHVAYETDPAEFKDMGPDIGRLLRKIESI